MGPRRVGLVRALEEHVPGSPATRLTKHWGEPSPSQAPVAGQTTVSSQQFTMATINATIEITERLPSESGWVQFKRWILTKIEEYAICGSRQEFSELECYRTDQRVRACVRAEMREHLGYESRETCVANAIDTVFRETGYDLADNGSIRQANKGVKRTIKEWDAYFLRMGVDPLMLDRDVGRRAKIVPKFAAACALHIRTKLGALANNEANVLLVQRKYLELCRKHGVRDVDTVLHQQFVMNTVFTESVLDDVAASRRRLPGWISWLESVPATGSIPAQVC